jgi:hypothetical protein
MFPVTRIIEAMLEEVPPSLLSASYEPRQVATTSPVGRAARGWDVAVKHVMESDDTQLMADWQRRQQMLRGWLDHLKCEEPGDTAAAIAARIARGDDVDLGAALFAPLWNEMLTEVEEAQAWATKRYAESARKAQVIQEGYRQLADIEQRCTERMTEIVDAVDDRIEQLSAADDAGRRQLIDNGRRDVAVVSDTAVKRIHVQIRRILDLDENTAAVTVDDWLARHLPT